MAEEKKQTPKKVKVFVKEDTKVWINGKEVKVKKGNQEVESEVARILIEAFPCPSPSESLSISCCSWG